MCNTLFPLRAIAVILICILLCCSGCASSKWAMDDPDYAAKYSKPYRGERVDKLERMAKQSVDARFTEGKGGAFIEVGAASNPTTLGGEIGLFALPRSYSEKRVGLIGLLGTDQPGGFVGVDGSLRVQTPTRVAPFAGLGGLAAYGEKEITIGDHDDDMFDDMESETEDDGYFMAAVYPEAGVHLWANGSARLSASGRYLITTDGRDSDSWYIGLTFSLLTGDYTW